jgi:flagellar biosynthesis protein FliP
VVKLASIFFIIIIIFIIVAIIAASITTTTTAMLLPTQSSLPYLNVRRNESNPAVYNC